MAFFRKSVLLLFLSAPSWCFSQKILEGKVLSAATGEPLAGASIHLLGTNKGSVTDMGGHFQIPKTAEKIIVSCVGYETREISIQGADTLTVRLEEGMRLTDCCCITAPYLPDQFRYPVPLQTLDRSELSRDVDLSLAPALNRIPGVYMQSGTLSTNRLTVRGIGSRTPFGTSKIRVFLHNIPLTNGAGESALEDVDMSLLGNVTLYKGPSSSEYGAALGGMLHLKARQVKQEQSGLSTTWQAGSYGLWRGTTTFEKGFEKGWLLAQHTRTHSDGYRENNRYDRQGGSVVAHFEPDGRNGFTFLADFATVKAQIPSSLNRADYLDNPRKAAPNWAAVQGYEDYDRLVAGLSHRLVLLEKNTSHLTWINAAFTAWRKNDESRPFNILNEGSQIAGLRSRLDWKKDAGAWNVETSLGGELFSENYDWQTYATNLGVRGKNLSDNREQRNFHNLFAQARLEKWMRDAQLFFEAGANYNATTYDLDDFFNFDSLDHSGRQRFEPIVSPRVSAGCFLHHKITVYLTASHGFSPPTFEETLTPEGYVNPAIQPERGWNYEIGSRGFGMGAWRWQYDVSLYTMRIRDLLVAERVGQDQYVGANAGKTIHDGLEISLSAKPLPSPGPVSLGIWGAYTYTHYRFADFVDRGADYSGNPLTGVAPHTASAGADAETRWGLYGNLNWQFSDKLPLRDDASIFSEPYHIVNIKAGWRFPFGRQRWELNVFAGMNNVLNEKYASMFQINAAAFGSAAPRYYYPGLPRNGYCGAALKWKFGKF